MAQDSLARARARFFGRRGAAPTTAGRAMASRAARGTPGAQLLIYVHCWLPTDFSKFRGGSALAQVFPSRPPKTDFLLLQGSQII